MNEFQTSLERFEISAPELSNPEIAERIQQYCVLLWHKNQQINLTRHTDWDTFVSRDLVDVLELSKLIDQGKEVLDVGTGGGVPGLLLAIVRPDLAINLAESVGKKAIALAEFATALAIDVQIYQERAERIVDEFRFDVTIARAVGSITKLCTLFNGRWLNVNRMLALKGPNWINEKQSAEEANLLGEIETSIAAEYQIPGCDWKSIILELTPRTA